MTKTNRTNTTARPRFPFTKRGTVKLLAAASNISMLAEDASYLAYHVAGAKRGRFYVPRSASPLAAGISARNLSEVLARLENVVFGASMIRLAGSVFDRPETDEVAYQLPKGLTARDVFESCVSVIEREEKAKEAPRENAGRPIFLIADMPLTEDARNAVMPVSGETWVLGGRRSDRKERSIWAVYRCRRCGSTRAEGAIMSVGYEGKAEFCVSVKGGSRNAEPALIKACLRKAYLYTTGSYSGLSSVESYLMALADYLQLTGVQIIHLAG